MRVRLLQFVGGGALHAAVPSGQRRGAATAADDTARQHELLRDAVTTGAKILPSQGIIENFVHHNPLVQFEGMPFNAALAHVDQLECNMSSAERAAEVWQLDPRVRAKHTVSDLCAVFLDRGAAKWYPENRRRGFLYFFASLEDIGTAAWRWNARATAKTVLAQLEAIAADGALSAEAADAAERAVALQIILDNLKFSGVPEAEWAGVIQADMLEARGWSGMFERMETVPAERPDDTTVRLVDLLAVKSILMRASIKSIAVRRGVTDRAAMTAALAASTVSQKARNKMKHGSAIASAVQRSSLIDQREELELEFEGTIIDAIGTRDIPAPSPRRPKLQVWTCIDDREESIRRHIEDANPESIETFGVAGFFGVPHRHRPIDGGEETIQAPVGVEPADVVVEAPHGSDAGGERARMWQRRRRQLGMATLWVEKASFSPLLSLALSAVVAPFAVTRVIALGFAPRWLHRVGRMAATAVGAGPTIATSVAMPFTPEKAAALLATTLTDMGTRDRFAPLVIVLGHGSESLNNPFATAYNCGACQGRDGAPNARLVARVANDPAVRRALAQAPHNINIPDDTHFVGGGHNTCSDTVDYFDVDLIPATHARTFEAAHKMLQRAAGKNALERCYRFLLAKPTTIAQALAHVGRRAIDPSEVRPELNHATNCAVIVGRRDLTKGRFLDRRAFLPSYDPFADDARGTSLERVITPALVVCSGINLEYLFSTIDVDVHGAGTKVPLNVVGNIGVLELSGDLRPGLPSQMTEMHIPIRAHFIIDAPVARLEAVLERKENLRRLVRNDWVRLFVRDPYTNTFYRQVGGKYEPVGEQAMTESFVCFEQHRAHGVNVAKHEEVIYFVATAAMVAACLGPIALHYGVFAGGALCLDPLLANPRGAIVAVGATVLALPALAFARRYLHGEFMFGRFAALCSGLLLGFNLVATAPTIAHALGGWTLLSLASTFLIGAYNKHQTIRSNATTTFAAFCIADMALLVAAAFTTPALCAGGAMAGPLAYAIPVLGTVAVEPAAIASVGLLVAAFFKSSQFPLTPLFARSMEGPTPASALGYAGLSAHIGVVLLAMTFPIWWPFEFARYIIIANGLVTAVFSSLVAKIRPDRKGALAYATSASNGLIFVVLGCGFSDTALFLCLGHAA
jgi:uncharacterized protein YbcC (UPF0753/DUF2309 family)